MLRRASLVVTGVALVAGGAVMAPWPSASGPADAATQAVGVSNFVFTPASITVTAGDSVTWSLDSGVHNVTADDSSFASPNPMGASYSFTFNTPGTYRYYCSIHGQAGGIGMSGEVVVQAAAATATSTAQATNTPAATSTPRTPSATAVSATPQTTPSPQPTAAPATSTPVQAATSTLAGARPSAGAGAGATLPNAGRGAAGASAPRGMWIALALMVAGGVVGAGGIASRRRR